MDTFTQQQQILENMARLEEKVDLFLIKFEELSTKMDLVTIKPPFVNTSAYKQSGVTPPSSPTGEGLIFKIYKKGVVVIGDTMTHKTRLKECGGRWNSKLRFSADGEICKGWIFPCKDIQLTIDNFKSDNIVVTIDQELQNKLMVMAAEEAVESEDE